MENQLPTKELIIAVIEKDDEILMRKKPEGSPPYNETWYSFGCEKVEGQDNNQTMKDYLKDVIGIDVEISGLQIPVDGETKNDHDGVEKKFIYNNLLCKYVGGEPKIPQGAEKVEWIEKEKLREYDVVPPSVKLLSDLGFLI